MTPFERVRTGSKGKIVNEDDRKERERMRKRVIAQNYT